MFRKNFAPHSSGFLIYTKATFIATQHHELEENLPESVWIQIKHRGEYLIMLFIQTPEYSSFILAAPKYLDRKS